MTPARNVVLVGMMGSGKTTVGAALAGRLGWTFVDTDALVESAATMTVQQIWDREGEPAFRKREAEAVQAVATGERQVIAAGGGAILSIANLTALQEAGPIVYLRATAQTIASRIDAAGRPLLAGDPRARIEKILSERAAAYRAAADLVVDTDGQTVDEVATAIAAVLRDEP